MTFEAADRSALTPVDPLDAYRRMFVDGTDGLSSCWYFGTSFVEIDGFPSIPVLHIETLMVYRTRTLSADAFRMDWWEIGYMRDPVTGEIAQSWTNPITGEHVATPNRFEEGPAHFIVRRDGAGLKLELVQPHARIQSVDVSITQIGNRVYLEQSERKVRGFPLPDGSMPSLDSGDVSQAKTRLSLFCDRTDLMSPDAPSSGAYEFELDPPAWMGFGDRRGRSVVRGIMVKAAMNDRINPTAWARLESIFPDRFENGRINPRWADTP